MHVCMQLILRAVFTASYWPQSTFRLMAMA